MIIVSQDKKEVINYDNVRKLGVIDNDFQKEFLKNSGLDIMSGLLSTEWSEKINDLNGFGIFAYFDNSDNTMLGQYKTEERAKKVLQEIIKSYADFNYLKSFPANITKSVEQFMYKKYSYFNVYEMPEE